MTAAMMRMSAGAFGAALGCVACAATPRAAGPDTVAAAHAPAPAPSPQPDPPCSALGCKLFDTPEQAFAEILRSRPAVLAVGEFHALKQHAGLATATQRFTDTLLPSLAGTASDIVIELWVGTGKCQQTQTQIVREQKPVTEQQAVQTPNEAVRLGDRAKALGIRPHALEPGCDELTRVLDAGEGAVREMLVLTASMTAARARLLFQRNQAVGADKTIVTYTGAMHNDLRPDHACGEPCSFGKQLDTLSGGRYVEVDLVVPEYIHAGSIWPQRVWYAHFDPKLPHRKTTLFNPSPGSFVLIFPTAATHLAPPAAR